MTEQYNGWTNYQTWRMNLEVFGGWSANDLGLDPRDFVDEDAHTGEEFVDMGAAVRHLAEALESSAEEILLSDLPTHGLAFNLVSDFIYKTNFEEIAELMLQDDPAFTL